VARNESIAAIRFASLKKALELARLYRHSARSPFILTILNIPFEHAGQIASDKPPSAG
jgi:hypothetical protein